MLITRSKLIAKCQQDPVKQTLLVTRDVDAVCINKTNYTVTTVEVVLLHRISIEIVLSNWFHVPLLFCNERLMIYTSDNLLGSADIDWPITEWTQRAITWHIPTRYLTHMFVAAPVLCGIF